jgi:hypothetical protein
VFRKLDDDHPIAAELAHDLDEARERHRLRDERVRAQASQARSNKTLGTTAGDLDGIACGPQEEIFSHTNDDRQLFLPTSA